MPAYDDGETFHGYNQVNVYFYLDYENYCGALAQFPAKIRNMKFFEF